ncbi:META domain-containing protein [Salinicola halimionae]|uniref:META domain-containing protein n=1 Tax=Salinicola halimionae TaxID=1949081 RepID=UPI000DA1E20E|nr:META domain-containing protein [Salinicola halimionae]
MSARLLGIAVSLLLVTGCASESTSAPTSTTEPPPAEMSSSQTPSASESLTGNYWKLMTLGGRPVAVADNQREAHLILGADGRVSGSTGCNRLMGSYTLQGDTLTFSQLASTRMACPAEMMALEQAWLTTLSDTAHYSISGQRLVLEDAKNQPLAELKVNALY